MSMEKCPFLTLQEIEKRYKVKARTLNAYITRGLVIPKDKLRRLGSRWLVDRKWVEEKYAGKERE